MSVRVWKLKKKTDWIILSRVCFISVNISIFGSMKNRTCISGVTVILDQNSIVCCFFFVQTCRTKWWCVLCKRDRLISSHKKKNIEYKWMSECERHRSNRIVSATHKWKGLCVSVHAYFETLTVCPFLLAHAALTMSMKLSVNCTAGS